ncbi:MAG: sporulation protein YlmC with PRC-barrel domain, partial [Desulforhopalus sp.]
VGVDVVTTTGYRASKLIGSAVYNDKAQIIGVLEDFIVGADDVATVAIVEVGGFLGIAGHRVAIPTELLDSNDLHQIVFPNSSREELQSLPEFQYVE